MKKLQIKGVIAEVDNASNSSRIGPSGLGTRLSTRGSSVRITFWSRLKGAQCHPPPQGGTGCDEMDVISLPHGWFCTEQDRGLICKKKNNKKAIYPS